MESLHEDTFKRPAPVRTPDDYADAPDSACLTCAHSAIEPHSFSHETPVTPAVPFAATPRTLSRTPSYAGFKEGTRAMASPDRDAAYTTKKKGASEPVNMRDATGAGVGEDAVPTAAERREVLETGRNGVARGLARYPSTSNLEESRMDEKFPAVAKAPNEAGIWDVDPLTVMDSSGKPVQNKSLGTPHTAKPKSKAKDSPIAQAGNRRILAAFGQWPEQDRAFSRTLGIFAFLFFLKAPLGTTSVSRPLVARIGFLGAAALAWPLESWAFMQNVVEKIGWETGGLQRWWKKEIKRNEGDGDGLVKVLGEDKVVIDDEGMEEIVLDKETFGTAEGGVDRTSFSVKEGEGQQIERTKGRRESLRKERDRLSQSGDLPEDAILIEDVKEAITTRVHKAARRLSEAVQDEPSSKTSTKRSKHSKKSSTSSTSTNDSFNVETSPEALQYVHKGFSVDTMIPQENATALFGILTSEPASGSGVEYRKANVPAPSENAAVLFGILNNAQKEKEKAEAGKKHKPELDTKAEGIKKSSKSSKKKNKNKK